ncbi:substrate-binding domain-containing protein, partial [Alphaproteobacteria bacterium]|nr:substrate-binding domain-containing protein [Alphaproteobacteria bacterium]
GSSTVYPFSTVVAETFGNKTGIKVPKIESTGSGGGMKLFCKGLGTSHPDITNASRRIKKSEFNKCKENGIDVVEIKVGYDGIVIANSKKATLLNLTKRQIFLALAKQVPEGNKEGGNLVDNPNKKWSDIDPNLPNKKIEVLGPPPTSGTRDAFNELAIEGGCKTFPKLKAIKKQDKKKYKAICRAVREDGAFIEAGENDNLIVQKLVENENAFGVFGFSFLIENEDKIQGSTVDGMAPTMETIADKSYGVSRPLYFYVKLAHVDVIPGIREFLEEYTSEDSWGPGGYLEERGMIPMPENEREFFKKNAEEIIPLTKL